MMENRFSYLDEPNKPAGKNRFSYLNESKKSSDSETVYARPLTSREKLEQYQSDQAMFLEEVMPFIQRLGGSIPSKAPSIPTDPDTIDFEYGRRKAYRQLKDAGLSDSQINTLIREQRLSKPTGMDKAAAALPDLTSMAGGTIGQYKFNAPVKGAAIGRAIGELGLQAYQKAVLPEKAPQNLAQSLTRTGIQAGRGAVEEWIGQKAIDILSPGGSLKPSDKEAVKYWRKATRSLSSVDAGDLPASPAARKALGLGKEMTPAQIKQSRGIGGFLETVSESSLFGGKRLGQFKAGQERYAAAIADDFLIRFKALDKKAAGELSQDILSGSVDIGRSIGDQLYADVGELASGQWIDISALKKSLSTMLKEASTEFSTGGKAYRVESLESPELIKTLDELIQLPDRVPYDALNSIRQKIGSKAFSGKASLLDDALVHDMKKAYKLITDTYKDPRYGLKDEALDAVMKANEFWSTFREATDDNVVNAIIKSKPEMVISRIANARTAKLSDVEKLVNLERVVKKSNPDILKSLRRGYVYNLVNDWALSGDKVSGKKLERVLSAHGDEFLDTIFKGSPEQLSEIKKFARALSMIESHPNKMGGSALIKLIQGGAVAELGRRAVMADDNQKQLSVGTLAVLLGPAALSQIFTRTAWTRALTNSLISGPGTRDGARLLSRLATDRALDTAIEFAYEQKQKDKLLQKMRLEASGLKSWQIPVVENRVMQNSPK